MGLIGEVSGHLSEKRTFYQSHEKREAVPSKVWMGASSRGTGQGKASEVRQEQRNQSGGHRPTH